MHERRFLHASTTLFGTVRIDGELDADAGATLLHALAAVEGVDPADRRPDGRTGGQRNADNLVQLAASFLAGGRGSGERSTTVATLVCDLALLAKGSSSVALGARRELEHVGPVAPATAQRLVCDASVSRAVMAGRSEVLDLGRATRIVSKAQRRALVLRDGGCRFPGCDRPPHWCDAHHLWHWTQGGPTDLDNLVLLCRRHHVLCHEGGWRLTRGPEGEVRALRPDDRPDGAEPTLAA